MRQRVTVAPPSAQNNTKHVVIFYGLRKGGGQHHGDAMVRPNIAARLTAPTSPRYSST
jgi:hypothetical protein